MATLNFLGFDGIATLVEEARGGAAAVGRATVLSLCPATVIFVALTYLASLFVLGRPSFAPGEPTDAAIYGIAERIGGPWFRFAASSKVLFAGTAAAAASQVATARLLFSMALARDRCWDAHRLNTPQRGVTRTTGRARRITMRRLFCWSIRW